MCHLAALPPLILQGWEARRASGPTQGPRAPPTAARCLLASRLWQVALCNKCNARGAVLRCVLEFTHLSL
jgi:hypothetical protein